MSLAIFDLDNTLLNGDSDHAWGEFLVQKGVVEEAWYRQQNDHFYALYKQGNLDIMQYLDFALQPLTRFDMDQLKQMHNEFMANFVEPMRLQKADALLAKHRQEGDFLLIITATNRFITGPIAQLLGVDDLIATDAEIIDDRYSGRVQGIPCYQEGKVTRLQHWLKTNRQSLEESYFYSDSINDLPLLKAVTYPVVVDADPLLTAEAHVRGWPCLSLRD